MKTLITAALAAATIGSAASATIQLEGVITDPTTGFYQLIPTEIDHTKLTCASEPTSEEDTAILLQTLSFVVGEELYIHSTHTTDKYGIVNIASNDSNVRLTLTCKDI